MVLTERDRQLIALLCDGLPLAPRPYWVIAAALGCEEEEVLERLRRLIDAGIVRRLGLIVRHQELGYRANGMVVWDIPDDDVGAVGRRLAGSPCVTLCYRRPRRLPDWPYNLFTMVHGKSRDAVRAQVGEMAAGNGLADVAHEILFSSKRYKQMGARYGCS